MAYMNSNDAIGAFNEVDYGKPFEYRKNNTGFQEEEFPFLVAVGPDGEDFRYAKILKTRAYIAVDEDEYGNPVVEKWHIKNHRIFS